MRPASRTPNRIALMLCLGFALLALFYATVTPPFEAPDEGSHFLYTHNVLNTGALPVLEDHRTVFDSQSVQRHHPPLYYLIGAALISGTNRADADAFLERNRLAAIGFVNDDNQNVYLHRVPPSSGDTGLAIWILRLFSSGLSTGTVWCVYRAARLATDNTRLALLSALLVASMPSFLHISSSINNDNLVTFLYAAGVTLCLDTWQRGFSPRLVIGLAAVAGCIALTKINGLALIAVILAVLIVGVLTRRFPVRQAAGAGLAVVTAAALVAGWWYVRNLHLYGDPLALQATLRIWSRGEPKLISLFELKGVWDTFWFTLGHLNIRGPEWLLSGYLPLLTLTAIPGVFVAAYRRPHLRVRLLFLALVAFMAIATLLVASSRINVSQGRILFPGLVAFAPLMIVGLATFFGRRGTMLLILPITLQALLAPPAYLMPAFRAPVIVTALPATARPLDVRAAGLRLIAYEPDEAVMTRDDWLRLTLYIQGTHDDNPFLFVKALDPTTHEVLGGTDQYPAMLPTNSLDPALIYAVPVAFRLDHAPARLMQLDLALGWHVPGVEQVGDGTFVPMTDANGAPLDALIVPGQTVLNPARITSEPQVRSNVVYGERIGMSGLTLSTHTLTPGEPLTVSLYWQPLRAIDEDWTLTLGMLDSANKLVAQADAEPPGYPTSAWIPNVPWIDTRRLDIPSDLPAGEYRLYVGLYRLSDFARLPPVGDDVQDNLYVYPTPLIVR